MRKPIAIFLILITATLAYGQGNILVKGYVYDGDPKTPLGMAAVQLKNSQLGTLADDNGYFELPIPVSNLKDSLIISYVGYTPQGVSIMHYKASDTLKIIAGGAVNTKPEAVITAVSAKGVLLSAIDNMRANFFSDSLISTGFYRQYHKENGKYVRLIEADVSVAMNIKSPYKYSFHELVKVNKERRSENYETNGDIHGDHLVDLLKENPYSYNKDNFLNSKKVQFYAPKFVDETDSEYVISLQYKESSSAKLENAKLVIQKGTYAITRIEVEKFPNPYYVKSRYANDSRWKLVNEKDIITTARYNGKYVVSSIQRVYNHHVLNRQTGEVDFVVEEAFEIYFDDYETDYVAKKLSERGFGEFSDLYISKYNYSQKFWDDYDLLTDHPLKEDIKKDIEHNTPLSKQYLDAGK